MTPMVPHTNRAQYDDYIVKPCGLTDGRIATVAPLTFGRALLTAATPENHVFGQYDECWYYQSHQEAIYALILWDGTGDPCGRNHQLESEETVTFTLKIWYAASDDDSPQVTQLTPEQVEDYVRPEVGFMHDMLSLKGAGVRKLELEVQQ